MQLKEQITTNVPGLVGVNPADVYITTPDNYVTITAAGYLNKFTRQGFIIPPNAFVNTTYADGSGNPINGIFSVSAVDGVLTMIPGASGGDVILPVTNGNFANFIGTTGSIHDAGYTTSNSALTIVVMTAGGVTPGNLAEYADIYGTLSESGIPSNLVLTTGITNPDVNINTVSQSVNITFTALNTGPGIIVIQSSPAANRYRILQITLNSNGTNFAGGDRNLQISDGTNIWTVIPSASLLTLANAQWGSTAVPYPASIGISTSSTPGNTIYARYSGGTTNYTSGSANITVLLQRTV